MTTSPPPMHTHSSAANASTTPGVFSVGRANNSHGLTSGMLSFSEQVNTMSQGNLRGSAADYRSHSSVAHRGYTTFPNSNCWTGQGGVDIDSAELWNAPRTDSASDCVQWCTRTSSCDCVVYHPDGGQCFRRESCRPSRFYHQKGFTVYMKRDHPVTPPHDHPVTPPHYIYPESNCWTGQGAVDIDSAEMWNAPRKDSADDCIQWCSSTSSCDCVVYHPDGGQCFRRKSCDPSRFYHQEGFTVYVMR